MIFCDTFFFSQQLLQVFITLPILVALNSSKKRAFLHVVHFLVSIISVFLDHVTTNLMDIRLQKVLPLKICSLCKFFFSQKTTTIKISLVPFTFNAVKLQVVTVDGKETCRAKEVCRALENEKKAGNVIHNHCSRENSAHKYELSKFLTAETFVSWPKESQKYNLYINEERLKKTSAH